MLCRQFPPLQSPVRLLRRQRSSLRSRREWVSARTSVPNASAKCRAGREKNGISLATSPQKVSRAHPLPPATQASNVEKENFKRKKLPTPRKNANIQLTWSKEGKCKRNQNDPNNSHVIFEGKSTLLKNCENFRMKTEL